MKTKFYFLAVSFLFIGISLFGQYEKQALIAEQYLQDNQAKWALTDLDIADIVVEKAYKSKHNGVTHITFQQRYRSIPIYNAQFKANLLPTGKVFYATNRFYTNLAEKITTHQAVSYTHLTLPTTPYV